jgi:acetyltransferase
MRTGLDSLLNPDSVAVFGVSEQEGKAGNSVVKHLLDGSVRVYGINPRGGTLFGLPIYRTVDEVPEVPDLAVIALPAELAPEVARACVRRGIGAVIVIAGGFGEVGETGRKLELELKDAVAGTHTRILGPNTLGLLIPRLKLDTIFLPSSHLRRPNPGGIAIISQSGSGVMGALDVGAFYGVGVSAFVGLGNRVDIDENELIEYFADDPHTSAIGMYLESFVDAQKFVDVCHKVSHRKPLVLVKAGRSSAGARAVALHTGSLAGSDRVTGGVLSQLGVFRAYDDEELLDTVRALSHGKKLTSRRVAILTGGGGMGVITADYVEAKEKGIAASLATLNPDTEARLAKIAVPYASVHNPIDLTPSATRDMYDGALEVLQDDPGVDAIIACLMYHSEKRDEHFTEMLCHWGKHGKKPLIVAAIGSETTMQAIRRMEAAEVPVFPSFWRAVKAVDVLAQRAEFTSRTNSLGQVELTSDSLITEPAGVPVPGTPLAEDEIKAVLRERGISTPDLMVLPKGEIPAEIPLTFPLVVKIRSADVYHKTEIKGVALNILDLETLEKTVAEMSSRFQGQDLLVEQMEPPGVEIIVGLIEDGTFGLSIMCGIGGVLAELYQDVTFRRVPINRIDADDMLRDLKAHALFEGFRGINANREAVIDLLLKVSCLGQDLKGHIDQMDLNPVIVRENKAVVVDAKLIWKAETKVV